MSSRKPSAACGRCRGPAVPADASGWLGENQRAYFREQVVAAEGLGRLRHLRAPREPRPRRQGALPAGSGRAVGADDYREPKGLYVLEAWANGVPVVQPRHGSFPELVEATDGGLLAAPDDPADLARGLRRLIETPPSARDWAATARRRSIVTSTPSAWLARPPRFTPVTFESEIPRGLVRRPSPAASETRTVPPRRPGGGPVVVEPAHHRGGSDIRIDSIRPPVFRPNTVPRS